MISARVYIGTSLDGFIARVDGSFDWLSKFGDDDAVKSYQEFMSEIDVIVIGRGTFETVESFPDWPYERPVYVVSQSLSALPDRFEERAVLTGLEPRDLLAELASRGFRSAYVDGGRLIQSFLRQGLVDELTIARVPVLIGSGIPLFGPLDNDIEFEHLRTLEYPNGLIRSSYRRKN